MGLSPESWWEGRSGEAFRDSARAGAAALAPSLCGQAQEEGGAG